MRPKSRFLRSAVARRVFWVVLAAAALPLVLFAALAHGVLADRLDATLTAGLQEGAKYAALRVYDRLVTAQIALSERAGADLGQQAIRPAPDSARKVFRAMATIEHGTGAVAGDAGVAEAWRQVAGDPSGPGRRTLWWLADGSVESRVLVGVRDARRWWVGEVGPDYLWGELRDRDSHASTCVKDAHGQTLLCSDGAGSLTDPAAEDAAGWRTVSWSLFTQADFGSVDWVFTRRVRVGQRAFGELPMEELALKAAAFSLLLVVSLSLVLVRRTTVPLELLMDGARRLGQRDWSARVHVDGGDEFGTLAGSFNEMAGRIERQVQALQVLSGIDREILGNLDLHRVLDQVTARLWALAPGARVALLLAPTDAGRWCRVTADGAGRVPVAIDPELLQRVERGPTTLHGADARSTAPLLQGDGPGGPVGPESDAAAVQVYPALANGRTRALLMVRAPGFIDADTAREIEDLCDRLAVMLAAAEREHALNERAVRDSLTGLYNRAGMIEALDRRLAAGPASPPFVLAFIDLDGFKAVNDARGHPVGDALLQEVADVLRAQVPTAELIARPGGDEFVLVLPGDRAAADALAAQLCRRLAEPFVLGGHLLRIGASIGLVRSPDDGRDRVELMRRADVALYAGKAAGRGRHAWFELSFDEQAADRAWLLAELPAALARNELCLHYQPRVKAGSGQLASLEALVRWVHPTRGMIGPMRFVPLAEETGLIDELGRWVLDAACRQLCQWRQAGVDVPRVAVNVSALQLVDTGFAAQVLAVLARHGLQPTDLEIELTESLFAGDTEVVCSRLSPLRAAGVLVALDDFGTGFSSLSSLHRLPVDVLKIDRSFVADLGRRESADAVARSIVALARALGKHVVAEGVESDDQLHLLQALGCDELQGYLFSKPLPADRVSAWLQREATTA